MAHEDWINEPQKWRDDNSHLFREIVKIAAKTLCPEERKNADQDVLMQWIWSACAYAATYDRKKDQFQLERSADIKELKSATKIMAAVKKLQSELKKSKKLANGAACFAIREMREKGIVLSSLDDIQPSPEERFDIALQALYDKLKNPIYGLKTGGFGYRFMHGCLLYPITIERSNLPCADMMLLFSLVLFFRKRSLKMMTRGREEAMPEGGESSYENAIDIVLKIFPDSKLLTYSKAKDRLDALLKRNRKKPYDKIGLCAWPHEM